MKKSIVASGAVIALASQTAYANVDTVGECEKYTQDKAEITVCLVAGGKTDEWENQGQAGYKNGRQEMINHRAIITNTGKVPVCNLRVDVDNKDRAQSVWPEFIATSDALDGNGMETVFFDKNSVDIGFTLPKEVETSVGIKKGFHECYEGDEFEVNKTEANENGETCEYYSFGEASISLCKHKGVDEVGTATVNAVMKNTGAKDICNVNLIAENADKSYASWAHATIKADPNTKSVEKKSSGMIDLFVKDQEIILGLAMPPEYADSDMYIDQGFYACDKAASKMIVGEGETPVEKKKKSCKLW